MTFFEKLAETVARNQSLLCVGLDPSPEQLPDRYRHDGDLVAGLAAWNAGVIAATHDLVCCYKPNIAFYEALGAPGMEMLRATLALIPPEIPVLLDAKRGDIGSTAAAYAHACFVDLGVDAVTLSPYLGSDSVTPFAAYADKGLFVLCHTSNPGASEFQALEIADWQTLDREPNQPLYVHVARRATAWSPAVGLVVGATYPAALAAVRAAAPAAWFLVPGIGAQGGDLAATLAAGLRDDGSGLIINASRSIAQADDHRAAADALRTAIQRERASHAQGRPTVSTPPTSPTGLDALTLELADLGAVKFGDFTLASGARSPIYIDLRLLVSRPALLAQVAMAYAALLTGIACDRIAGVPYAALPIGTALSLTTGMPLIYPRKESKSHGLAKEIEGVWQPGERVVIVEDLITSGGSTIKTAQRLREAGLVVEDAIVLIDREQGGPANLAAAGIRAHSVLKLSGLIDTLVAHGRLSVERRTDVLAFLAGGR